MRIIKCKQRSPEWFEAHRGFPTASNFDRIITPKTGKLSASVDDLIAELIAQLATTGPLSLPVPTQAMANGITTEPEARDWYEMTSGLDVQQVGMVLDDNIKFGCSPDGLIDGDDGLELKCPTLKTQARYLMSGSIPDDYKAQVHGCMIVTGRKKWTFVSYSPGLPPLVAKIAWDSFTDALEERMGDFYAKYFGVLEQFGFTYPDPERIAT